MLLPGAGDKSARVRVSPTPNGRAGLLCRGKEESAAAVYLSGTFVGSAAFVSFRLVVFDLGLLGGIVYVHNTLALTRGTPCDKREVNATAVHL